MSALTTRTNGIIPLTPAADQTAKLGYAVDVSGDTATVSSSATTAVLGLILEGGDTDEQSSVGILGAICGTVRLKASGTITKGARVQQAADGTVVTDAGSGSRVVIGVALEDAVSGDLFEVATHVPLSLS